MEFFGLNSLGVSDPIKFLMKPGFKEPDNPPKMLDVIKKGDYKCSFYELIRYADPYSGFLDGYAYKSYFRIQTFRDKGYSKPIGPSDTYKEPITGATEFGWFLTDEALKGKTWYKDDLRWPKNLSDRSRFLNEVLMKDKNYRM